MASASLSYSVIPKSSSLSSSNSLFFSNPRATFYAKKKNCVVLSRRTAQKGLECNCLFGLGVPELAVIAGVAALVFGPKKLPEIGRSIGKTLKSFQQAAKEFETELKKAPEESTDSDPERPVAVGNGMNDVDKKEVDT